MTVDGETVQRGNIRGGDGFDAQMNRSPGSTRGFPGIGNQNGQDLLDLSGVGAEA